MLVECRKGHALLRAGLAVKVGHGGWSHCCCLVLSGRGFIKPLCGEPECRHIEQYTPQALHIILAAVHRLSQDLETGCPSRGFIYFWVSKVWYKVHTTN